MPNTPAGFNAAVLQGDLRFGQGGITVDDLSGVFLRSITDNGNNTYDIAMQGTDGTDTTVTITATGGSGASITSGTADPTGGAAGDAYLQVDASDVIQSIWRNVSGTWTEYTLPAGGGGGAHTEQRVLNEEPSEADSDTLGKFIIDPSGNAYATHPETVQSVLATGDFAVFSHASYIGELGGDPNPLSVPIDTYYFLITDHHLRKTALNSLNQAAWTNAAWSELLVTGARYRGNHASDAIALFHVQQDGDVYYLPSAASIRVVSNFVAGSNAHIDYEPQRLAFAGEIPTIKDDIERVGSLPAATATSPDLVFLTHTHTVGARDDATVTIGFASNSSVAGYSDGEVNDALGSVDAASPLVELFGIGAAADYLVETIYSFNRSWIEEFDNIYLADTSYVLGPVIDVSGGVLFFRRIVSYPENLSAATLALNFERPDGTFYFTDGANSSTEEGLYQKVDDGQGGLLYDRLTSRGFLHRDGVGAPLDPPVRAGEAYMDDLGRQWNAAGQVHISITDPTGTTQTVAAADFGSQYVPDPSSYGDLMTRGGEGAWYVERYNSNFPQIQGTAVADIVLSNTFRGVYTWIVANVTGANTATNRFYRDNTTFLGSFHRLQDALNELQLVLQGEAFPPVTTHLYLWSDSTVTAAGISRIKRIVTFVAGVARRSDDFHWVGPIGGADDQTAGEVPVDATQFSGNLGSGDTDVQTALETIDGFTLGGGGGGGTDDQTAAEVSVDATGFTGNLATTDDDVQAVADKVDALGVLTAQDRNLLEQIPRLGELASDFRQKDVDRVWEAPANTEHGMAVFTGLTTPTDAEIEAATYVNPLDTPANTTTRLFVVKVDIGDFPGDIRVRETGLPGNQTYIITGALFYLLHSDILYDYYAHAVRVQNVRHFALEEHELPDGHTEYRGDTRAARVQVDASGFDGVLSDTDIDLQTALESLDDARVPTDNTLAYNSNDELGVNVTNVIDRLNETVEYYSNETGNEYDDGGHASMGEDYDTSAHRHIIHKVQIDINGADTSNGFWRAGVFSIDDGGDITAVLGRSGTEGIDVDQRHTFVFPNPVEVPASQRIRIYGSRVDNDGESGSGTRSAHLSRGDEDSASPRESYDDSHLDFARIRHVRANTAFPDVGDTTHDHDANSVRGDIKIWYTVKIDHGNLVGDGNVNAAHISSGSAADGEVLTADGSGGASWEASTGGGGGSGGGYGAWASIGEVTGSISGNPVTVALNANETIDDYEELYIHIEANDTNDQRVVSHGFRVTDVPTTTLAGGGLGLPFAGNATDEGAVLVRRNTDGDSLVLDVYGSVINFPATAVTTIYARALTTGGGGGGTDDQTAAEVPVTATGFTGNLSSTDTDVQTALDTIDALDLGGGGGTAPDRIVLADAVGVSNTAGPHEIALTEAMVARQLLSFFVFSSAGASPDGIGYLLSDDILALTAEATAPTDAENALPVVTASYSASNFSQQSGNYFVYRKDDSTLWVRPTRLAAHTLTITATPLGGGGTGAQLAGGLTEQVIVGSRLATTEYGLGTLWTGVVDAISPTISPPINPDNLLQIAVGLRIDTEAAPELIISGAGIRRMTHTSDPLPSTAVSSDEIPGAYYSARVSRNNEDRVIEVNPTLSWMEKRRQAGRYGILFAFTDNAAGNLTSIRPFVSAAVEIDIEYIVAIIGA